MTDFTLYPAVDLRNGRAVRLFQGDPDRETNYGNPAEAARRWIDQGASWLHVVNLDGALEAKSTANTNALEQIFQVSGSLGARVQFGGGIRKLEDLEKTLELGASRVVLGTAAVVQPALARAAVERFGPEAVALGVDLREGRLRIRGWQESAETDPISWGASLQAQGLKWAVYTDISRDGAGRGLNARSAAAFQERTGLQVIAAGGVSGIEDILDAREQGLHGAITGRALYEGTLDLKDAVRRLKGGC
jgi:phosphoribosylformimino-5-aminoimidazole carboxamide ribotide isomerase